MSLPESFKVYKKEVTVNIDGKDVKYDLLPLSGKSYSKFITLFKNSSKVTDDPTLSAEENAMLAGQRFFDGLTEDDFNIYHDLILETFINSYDIKGKDVDDMDLFVSVNLISLIPILPTVNLPKVDKE